MEKTAAQEAAAAISRFSNNMGRKQTDFIDAMDREHRTLQQNFTGLCLAWLQHLSTLQSSQYDLRNEASVKIAKKLLKDVDKYDLSLPFI